MAETLYKVYFSKKISWASDPSLYSCQCNIISMEDQPISNFYFNISDQRLLQWITEGNDELVIVIKCCLEIIKSDLKRSFPRENINIDEMISAKPNVAESEPHDIYWHIQEDKPFLIFIPPKIGF